MKLWIDDKRPAPEGWIHINPTIHSDLVLFFIQAPLADAISFDNDFGIEGVEGKHLANYIELLAHRGQLTKPVRLTVHSDNGPAIQQISQTIEAIYNRFPNLYVPNLTITPVGESGC